MTPPPDSREAWGAGLRPPEMIRRNGTLHETGKDDTVFLSVERNTKRKIGGCIHEKTQPSDP